MGVFLALCMPAALDLIALTGIDQQHVGDFFAVWSWSRFAHTSELADLYDVPAMHAFQTALDPVYSALYYPFLYPPTYLLLIWPLGWLDLGWAQVAWSVVTLAGFHIALFGLRWRGWLTVAAVSAPATIVTLICGQNGLLTAGLMLAGLQQLTRRPVLAGVLLGLLSYKPQFALMIPVVLVATRDWRAVAGAAATLVTTGAVSTLAFGRGVWVGWSASRGQSAHIVGDFVSSHWRLVPTVAGLLQPFELVSTVTIAAQAGSALVAGVVVWTCWRRAPGSALAVASVPLATLLATPYAFVYDLPLVAGATLVLMSAASRRLLSLSMADIGILAVGFALPQLMVMNEDAAISMGAPVIAILLAWVALRSSHVQRDDRLAAGLLNKTLTSSLGAPRIASASSRDSCAIGSGRM